ncbi:methyl-accepting chemotaxis protein [Nocardioides pocheonensis]|nr:methyl-accepting chemotaxis protein [Nocardioides pocheonensis]
MGIRMTVGRKLAVLASCGALVALGISGASLVSMGHVKSTSDVRVTLNRANAVLVDLDMQQSNLQIVERDQLLATNDAARAAAVASLGEVKKRVDADWAALDGIQVDQAEVGTSLSALRGDYATYVDDVTKQMPVLGAIDPASPQAEQALKAEAARAAATEEKITATRAVIQRQVDAALHASEAAMSTLRTTIVVGLLVGLLALGAISLAITRSITRPLRHMVTALGRVADGDLTTEVAVKARDEIGEMAGALSTALGAMRGAVALVGETSTGLASASEELTAVSTQLGANAEETSAQAGTVSVAAEQASGNVTSMSAATEELTASIREIARSASTAAGVANQAAASAQGTSQAVERLDAAGVEIGEISRVINSIAEQTNLLALNATIEAARAGEAGKGFAVVANEVKELAQETAKATEDISRKIGAIQATTSEVGEAIDVIVRVVNEIDELQTTIAAAVEEQSATAAEISRSVEQLAVGSGDIAQNIGGVAQAADATAQGAGMTQQSAVELSHLATRIDELVGTFTY